MRRSEKGRSMVEMLGVLAIIGVLSVGGIYGYTVAMNKYKANEIVQTASMLAVLARGASAGQGDSAMTVSKAGLTTTIANIDLSTMSADGTQTVVPVALPSTVTGDIKNAVCAIAPKTAETGKEAGYYLNNCPS